MALENKLAARCVALEGTQEKGTCTETFQPCRMRSWTARAPTPSCPLRTRARRRCGPCPWWSVEVLLVLGTLPRCPRTGSSPPPGPLGPALMVLAVANSLANLRSATPGAIPIAPPPPPPPCPSRNDENANMNVRTARYAAMPHRGSRASSSSERVGWGAVPDSDGGSWGCDGDFRGWGTRWTRCRSTTMNSVRAPHFLTSNNPATHSPFLTASSLTSHPHSNTRPTKLLPGIYPTSAYLVFALCLCAVCVCVCVFWLWLSALESPCA
ncbi:hypothetical protein B0H34DRAFT_686998 [Crassisporium funariophilum]|nr:hypothetical protein B0H34DRAFT_686998 [Crassisporium funariophilum]